MFWEKTVEPINKFKFYAEFNAFIKSDSNPLNVLEDIEPIIKFAVKKIDAPKLNLDFERAYVNEYVHYFQNGPINWEPINITLMDARSFDAEKRQQNEKFYSIRRLLNTYIITLFPEVTGQVGGVNEFVNRTNLVDLPVLCNNIDIISVSRFASKTFPTSKDLKDKTKIGTKVVSNSEYLEDRFIITRPRLTKIDFGSFDYNSDDINEITLTVVPEWCQYTAFKRN